MSKRAHVKKISLSAPRAGLALHFHKFSLTAKKLQNSIKLLRDNDMQGFGPYGKRGRAAQHAFSPSNCKMTRLLLVNVTDRRLKCTAELSSAKRPVQKPRGRSPSGWSRLPLADTHIEQNICKLAAGKHSKASFHKNARSRSRPSRPRRGFRHAPQSPAGFHSSLCSPRQGKQSAPVSFSIPSDQFDGSRESSPAPAI